MRSAILQDAAVYVKFCNARGRECRHAGGRGVEREGKQGKGDIFAGELWERMQRLTIDLCPYARARARAAGAGVGG